MELKSQWCIALSWAPRCSLACCLIDGITLGQGLRNYTSSDTCGASLPCFQTPIHRRLFYNTSPACISLRLSIPLSQANFTVSFGAWCTTEITRSLAMSVFHSRSTFCLFLRSLCENRNWDQCVSISAIMYWSICSPTVHVLWVQKAYIQKALQVETWNINTRHPLFTQKKLPLFKAFQCWHCIYPKHCQCLHGCVEGKIFCISRLRVL